MSLLDKASLISTPNGFKASKLYSVVPSSGAGDMTVVRATTATRVNSSSLIESVAVNVPRIDYTNGSCPSLLVEPQRTNLIFPSATLTTQTRTVTAVSHTLSFYGTGSIVLSGVHSATLTGTGVNNRVTLTFTPTAGSLILTVTGSVTNAQLEAGSFATSYIPTVASTVTRNADVISKTGISSLINSQEGVLFADLQFLTGTGNIRSIHISNGSNNNRIGFFGHPSVANRITFAISNGGVITDINYNGVVLTNRNKVLIRYSGTTFTSFINGVQSVNQTFTPFTANFLNRIGLDYGEDILRYEGRINSIQLYKTALTDAECIALTTL